MNLGLDGLSIKSFLIKQLVDIYNRDKKQKEYGM